jgi:hypothetical protein
MAIRFATIDLADISPPVVVEAPSHPNSRG